MSHCPPSQIALVAASIRFRVSAMRSSSPTPPSCAFHQTVS
ncbi:MULTISPECIES: hypothetical protein [Methylobacteriaceae]